MTYAINVHILFYRFVPLRHEGMWLIKVSILVKDNYKNFVSQGKHTLTWDIISIEYCKNIIIVRLQLYIIPQLFKFTSYFLKFYAPWCGHCKKLEPIWKHVDQSLANLPLRIGRIDCTRFPSVAQEFDVQGYPTILL
jgi:thiol-disulfide isomerase/thioredoxin